MFKMLDFKNSYDEKDAGLLFTVFIGTLIIVSSLLNIIVQIAALFTKKNFEALFNTPAILWVMQGVLYICLLMAVLLYHKHKKVNLIKAGGLNNKCNILDIAAAVFLGVGMLFVSLLFTFLFNYFLQKTGYNASASFEINSVITFIAGIFILCVLPAVTEEIVFRGAVFKGYSKVFKTSSAVLLSALFFMFMHMKVPQFLNAFLTGVFMAFIIKKTHNILITVIMHFINNFTIILFSYIESFNNEPAEEITALNFKVIAPYLIYFAIGLGLLAIGLLYFLAFKKKPEDETKIAHEEEKPEPVFSGISAVRINNPKNVQLKVLSYAAIGLAACILLSVINLVSAYV